MDAFKTHGAFSWSELMTPKPAAEFYGSLFGWTIEAMDVPTVGRMACIRDPQGAAINIITYEPRPA